MVDIWNSITEKFQNLFSSRVEVEADTSEINTEELREFLDRVYENMEEADFEFEVGETYELPVSFQHEHGPTVVEMEFLFEEKKVSLPESREQVRRVANEVIQDFMNNLYN